MRTSKESTTANALELTRRAFASATGGDLDAMMSFYGPDSVWEVSSWGLGTHAGLSRIRHFLDDWIGSFDEFEMEVEEMLDLGNGVVYAVATQIARPAGSRGRLRLRSASVFVWVEGVAVRVTHYRDIDEARAAAEQAASAAISSQL
jgi:ketosteroid isomerase-like protein